VEPANDQTRFEDISDIITVSLSPLAAIQFYR